MSRANSKEQILEAAEAVVVELGASQMTLDAVAERCGISKGGLMYNYPSKDALLAAMVQRLHERIDQQREHVREAYKLTFPDQPVNDLYIEIRTVQLISNVELQLGAALLAATFHKPELLSDLRCSMRERLKDRIVKDRDYSQAATLFFAALGLHFHRLLHLSMVSEEEEKQIFESLLCMASTPPSEGPK